MAVDIYICLKHIHISIHSERIALMLLNGGACMKVIIVFRERRAI